MLGFVGRRLLLAAFTTWAITVLSFVIIQLPPGDFVTAYIAAVESAGDQVSDQEAAALREEYALDQPIYFQYFKWMRQIAQGNFGMSMSYRKAVIDVVGERLVMTVVVTLAAVMFTWVIALPVGIYSAVRQYSPADHTFTFVGFLGLAIPDFLLALALMYFIWQWFGGSIGGLFSPEYLQAPWSLARLWDLIKHLPIPAVVLGTAGTAGLIRIMRANLLDELSKPYVVTARAKGLPETSLILKYPVRVALNPFISMIGYTLPFLVSGSIIVSIVLGLPTVGPLLYASLIAQDMFLAGAIILFIGIMTVVGTLISDLLLAWVDPRIRFENR
jgi:peptide/nickel transport system permease protein